MKPSRVALFLLFTCAGLAQAATKTAATAPTLTPAERDQKEQRFVALLRSALHAPPTDEKKEAMATELSGLLFSLAGLDPAHLPPDAEERATSTQSDILARRDPTLGDELLQEMKRYACHMKQAEAKMGLRMVHTGEMAWEVEHDAYTASLKEAGVEGILEPKRYDFAIVQAGPKGYRARAAGKDDMAGDVWEVEGSGEPKNSANLCEKLKSARSP